MDRLRQLTLKAERCYLSLTGTYIRQPKETSSKRLKALARDRGIKIITADKIHCLDIKYDAPTRAQVVASYEKFKESLGLYTDNMLSRCGVEQFILCRNLSTSSSGKKYKSAAGVAMVGYDVVDTLFLDARYFLDDDWIGSRVFHHELFHAIDYRDTWFGHYDSEWKGLQGSGFKYGTDKLYEHLNTFNQGNYRDVDIDKYVIRGIDSRPSREPGFVSDYARYSYVEDKAEVFASLLTDYSKTMRRSKHDLPLRRKIEKMKELLHEFCPDFNDSYWKERELS